MSLGRKIILSLLVLTGPIIEVLTKYWMVILPPNLSELITGLLTILLGFFPTFLGYVVSTVSTVQVYPEWFPNSANRIRKVFGFPEITTLRK